MSVNEFGETPEQAAINDKIEAWHFEGAGPGLELHEYLGWTWEEYAKWATTGVLPNANG